MRVDDVAPNGYTFDRATLRQKKTGAPGPLRIDGADPAGDRRLPSRHRPTAGSVPVRWSGLGHTKIESTARYLGIKIDDAIEIAEKIDV